MKFAAIASWTHTKSVKKGMWFLGIPALTIASLVGINIVQQPVSLAPEIKLNPQKDWNSFQSLDDLYAMRDSLSNAVLTASTVMKPADTVLLTSDQSSAHRQLTSHQRFTLNVWISREENYHAHWNNAKDLARHATNIGQRKPLTPSDLDESYEFWNAAIHQLNQISEDSFLGNDAVKKTASYQHQRAEISRRQDEMRPNFLRPIAESTDLALEHVHITVCNLEIGDCEEFNGDRPPASPASLIKVPVAVALMQQLVDERLALSTSILVDEQNYTEDASEIWVGEKYSLKDIVVLMINQSSNIATNQLIDYLSFKGINTVFRDRGYEQIYVGHKLIGENTVPEKFGRRGTNRITTNELSAMMDEIYQRKYPGSDILIGALASQTDERMGKAALKGKNIVWLGEKTGWNSKVLGSTSAAIIGSDRYVITVALDHTAHTLKVQQVIGDIADYILENGGL